MLAAEIIPDLNKALSYLNIAGCLEPGCSSTYRKLGISCVQAGDHTRAVDLLEKACQLDPEQAESWLSLAKAYQQAGDLDRAASAAEQAIEKSGDMDRALVLRGEIALQAGNPRGALSRAQVVLRNHPDQSDALHLLALSLEALNRTDDALLILEKAIPAASDPLVLQMERLQLMKRSHGLDKALDALKALTRNGSKQVGLLALQAEWLAEAGLRDEAIQAAQAALLEGQGELTRDKMAALNYMIGVAMRQSGQLDQAIHHLSESVQVKPSHVDGYLELGRAYQDRRDHRQALKIYQKAINCAPGDYRPYYQAGIALKDCKDYVAAEAILRKATQLAPDEVCVHRLLGAVVALNLVHSRSLTAKEPR